MNWVGGARSRVRLQSDRKKQKEFFERKRLMNKVNRIRPPSPGDGRTKKSISQDLLSLQTLTTIHGGNSGVVPKRDPPRQAVRVDLDAAKRARGNFRRPDRDLEIPMSPIGKPSTLEFLDSTSDFMDQPKVSTQKVPHQTVFKRFGQQGLKGKMENEQQQRYKSTYGVQNDSCLTESLFPPRKHPQYNNEHLANKSRANDWDDRRHSFMGNGKRPLGVLERAKRPPSAWEKSYDHETPFNFGSRLVKKPKLQQIPPQTKGSLLQFHQNQGENDHGQHIVKRHPTVVDNWSRTATKEERDSARSMAAEISTGMASEPTTSAEFRLDNISTTAGTAKYTSSTFDENPLFVKTAGRPERQPPKSTSTVFDESILGPLSRHKIRPSTEWEESGCDYVPPQLIKKGNSMSTFEKMMFSLETCQTSTTKTLAPKEISRVKPRDTSPPCDAHHMQWKNFIMGARGQKDINIEQKLPQECSSPKKHIAEAKQSSDYKLGKLDKVKKPFPRLTTIRNKNITVMEELLCLDEELTSSLESDILVSQEFTLTPAGMFPEDPIRQVPDVESDNSAVLCNPTSDHQSSSEVPSYSQDKLQDQDTDTELATDHTTEQKTSPEISNKDRTLPMEMFDCSTQTMKPQTKLYREVSCDCDIWNTETTYLKRRTCDASLQYSPQSDSKQASTQTDSPLLVDSAMETIENAASKVPIMQDFCTQTDNTPDTSLVLLQDQEVKVHHVPADGLVKLTSDASVQACTTPTVQELKKQIAYLEKELHTAQNTVIWQSLLMKLQQV